MTFNLQLREIVAGWRFPALLHLFAEEECSSVTKMKALVYKDAKDSATFGWSHETSRSKDSNLMWHMCKII